MLIYLNKSKMFTTEPAQRFAREFGVGEDVWVHCWLKYKTLRLSIPELCEYVAIRTGRRPSYNSVSRWITRTEIYSKAREAMKTGVVCVRSDYFGENEGLVLKELTRNVKSSVKKEIKNII